MCFTKTANPLPTWHEHENIRQWRVLVVGSPSLEKWLTRLSSKWATEQLTDVGIGFLKIRLSKIPHNEVSCYCRKDLGSNTTLPGRHEQYLPGDKRRSTEHLNLKEHSSIPSKIGKRLKYVWIMIFYTTRNYKTRVKLVFAGLFTFYCVHEKWSLTRSSQGLTFPEELL